MKATCTFNHQEIVNCKDPPSGTIAKFECLPFYEDLSRSRNAVQKCFDGSWETENKPRCVPGQISRLFQDFLNVSFFFD